MSAASSASCTSVYFLSWVGSIPAPGIKVYCFNEDGSIAKAGSAGEPTNKSPPRNSTDNFLWAAVVRENMPPLSVSDAEALRRKKLFSKANLLVLVLLATGWQRSAFDWMKSANNRARCNTIISFFHSPILFRIKTNIRLKLTLFVFYAAAKHNAVLRASTVTSLSTFS